MPVDREVTPASELVTLQRTIYASKNATRRWLHATRRAWIVNVLQRYAATANGRVLEVGFGSGTYLPVLAELYREVVASDVEEAHLRRAEQLTGTLPNLQVVADDITRTQLPDASFDLILCSEVVEHIPDSASALASMHRLLRPGGHLVLSTPQRWSLLEALTNVAFLPRVINVVRWIYREPVFPINHINVLTEGEATALLEAAGFRICERFTSGMYLPLVAEFTGQYGVRLEQWLESQLRSGSLRWLLWTQYYIAEA